MKEFLLSDESINSYGFKVLTSGINLNNFKRNPVMYYNHNRELGVIGNWKDISLRGKELFGVPVFDEKDELGAKIAGKVKDGFIRAVSIGIDKMEIEKINNEVVITSCDLLECSVCDIPSNKNALMLYVNDKQVTDKDKIIQLCNNLTNMTIDINPIISVLGLSQNASVDEIVSSIMTLQNNTSPQKLLNDALAMELVAKNEENELLELAQANPVAFEKYISKRKETALSQRAEKGLTLTNAAILDGRINCDAGGKIREFWVGLFKSDFKGAEMALNALPKRVSPMALINKAQNNKNNEDRSQWTLSDYRKKAPKELKNNPRLYKQLLEQESINNQ